MVEHLVEAQVVAGSSPAGSIHTIQHHWSSGVLVALSRRRSRVRTPYGALSQENYRPRRCLGISTNVEQGRPDLCSVINTHEEK